MRCADAHLRLAELYARLQALGRHPLPPQCWGGWGGRPSAQPTLDDDWLELAEELQPLWQEHEHCWRAEGVTGNAWSVTGREPSADR